MYDLVIVGGGPAGVAAGVYAARKQMKAALITETFGGQSIVSNDVQNWIGTKSISGLDLAKNLEEHLRAQENIEIIDSDRVDSVQKLEQNEVRAFKVTTAGGKIFESKTILVTTGSSRRKLGVPGEKELDGKGVAYCATCDAPIFKNKIVAVIGGGNSGLESVVDLLGYASKIFLIERSNSIKGDQVTFEKIKSNPKVEIMLDTDTKEIVGEKFVTSLKFTNSKTNEPGEIKLDGVFVEIGAIPNTDFVKDLVKLNSFKEIVVDHKTQQSSLSGIWAAGDASDVIYKQNNISAGDAIKAVLNIQEYLMKQ